VSDAGFVGNDLLPARAMVAAKSVGKAQAYSSELVCSDCVPPRTAG